jgi:hypothetical protein
MSATAPSRPAEFGRPLPRFRLNVEEALRFFARDPRWPTKLAVGVLCQLLGITIIGYLLAQGYLLTVAERVARVEPEPLPEWRDFGELLRKGAMAFIVHLAYGLPLILLAIVFVALLVALLLGLGGLGQLGGAGGSPGFGLGTLALIVGIVLIALLIMALGLLVGAILPAGLAQLALHDADPRAALRPPEVFGFIRRHLGSYALAVGLYFAATLALSGVSGGLNAVGGESLPLAMVAFFFATGVGSVVGFFAQLFLMHMIGQLCWYERLVRGAEIGVSGGMGEGYA